MSLKPLIAIYLLVSCHPAQQLKHLERQDSTPKASEGPRVKSHVYLLFGTGELRLSSDEPSVDDQEAQDAKESTDSAKVDDTSGGAPTEEEKTPEEIQAEAQANAMKTMALTIGLMMGPMMLIGIIGSGKLTAYLAQIRPRPFDPGFLVGHKPKLPPQNQLKQSIQAMTQQFHRMGELENPHLNRMNALQTEWHRLPESDQTRLIKTRMDRYLLQTRKIETKMAEVADSAQNDALHWQKMYEANALLVEASEMRAAVYNDIMVYAHSHETTVLGQTTFHGKLNREKFMNLVFAANEEHVVTASYALAREIGIIGTSVGEIKTLAGPNNAQLKVEVLAKDPKAKANPQDPTDVGLYVFRVVANSRQGGP